MVLVFLREYPLIGPLFCLGLFTLVRLPYSQGTIYMAVVRPFISKLQILLEFFSKLTMLLLMGFIIYLRGVGKTISERALMNVGYAMILVILLNLTVTLVALLVTTVIGIV